MKIYMVRRSGSMLVQARQNAEVATMGRNRSRLFDAPTLLSPWSRTSSRRRSGRGDLSPCRNEQRWLGPGKSPLLLHPTRATVLVWVQVLHLGWLSQGEVPMVPRSLRSSGTVLTQVLQGVSRWPSLGKVRMVLRSLRASETTQARVPPRRVVGKGRGRHPLAALRSETRAQRPAWRRRTATRRRWAS